MSSTNQSVNLILKNGTMKSSLKNHTIFTRDNLEVMRGMADECIDLIYLDPPFNSNHNYAAPIGSEAAGAEFKDTWTLSDIDLAWYGEIENQYSGLYMLLSATRQVHGKSRMAYLIYMAIRVMEMKRILKPTGSIFLHCDPTASHYLKLMMDEIFGNKNSRNEIAWCYIDPAGRRNSNYYKKTHDIIFWYAKNKNKYKTNVIAKSGLAESTLKRYGKYFDGNGQITYRRLKETNPGTFKSLKSIPEDLDEVWLDKEKGTNMSDWWNDIVPIKRKGGNQNPKEMFLYPTQKPIALLERILETASSEKDIVLDPFCGCATACVAAEKLGRQWLGIDISPKAAELIQIRVKRELGILLFKLNHRTDIPTDRQGELSRDIKNVLYGKQEGNCAGCNHHFRLRRITVDHIVPTSKGGGNVDENLQLLCGYCNSLKGNRTQEYLISRLKEENALVG